MSILPIRILGDPVLRTPCDAVTRFDDDLAQLIDDLFETMYAAPGVGLAANQVGVLLRLFVYDCPDADRIVHRGYVINPSLTLDEEIPTTLDEDEDSEGCLSVPGDHFPTARAFRATVRGIDLDEQPLEVSGTGFFARCLQHECGHLDGRLFVDELTGKHRRAAQRFIRDADWAVSGATSWLPPPRDT